MRAPSELDLAEWRNRQLALVEHAKRMTDSRKDALRSKLFRARSEPVPDGSMFYAWRTIEARARQEAAIRAITTAIDLEPPGSQADQYELGEDGRPTQVYYASYGSNMHEDRFLTYINGGTPPGSARTYDGCDDKTPPADDIPIRYTGARPHFALTSRVWNGGIAFIDPEQDQQTSALGRAYAVSIGQFDQIVAQENGLASSESVPVPLDEALTKGRSVTGEGVYQTIVHVGDYNGRPVLTFTAPFSARDALTKAGRVRRGDTRLPVMTNKPSAAYVRMIGSGLGQTFGMDEVAQADYIRGCPGGDRWPRQELVRTLRAKPEEIAAAEAAAAPAAVTPAATVPAGAGRRPATPVFSDGQRSQLMADLEASIAAARAGRGGEPRGSSGRADRRPAPDREAGREAGRDAAVQRGEFAAVKQYGTVDEQRVGVRRWRKAVATTEAEVTDAQKRLDTAVNGIRDALGDQVGSSAAFRAHRRATEDLATATKRLAEARTKERYARSQKPAAYYLPAATFTPAQWRKTQDEVRQRVMEASVNLDRAADRLAAAEAAGETGLSRFQATVRDEERAVQEGEARLAEIEQKLAESRAGDA